MEEIVKFLIAYQIQLHFRYNSCFLLANRTRRTDRNQSIYKNSKKTEWLTTKALSLVSKSPESQPDRSPPVGISKWWRPFLSFCFSSSIERKSEKEKRGHVYAWIEFAGKASSFTSSVKSFTRAGKKSAPELEAAHHLSPQSSWILNVER